MKILVVRPDAIGDVVLMIPLINSIKAAYPDAEIYTLQQPYTIPILEKHPAVTAVIPDWRKMGKAGWISGFRAYVRYIKSFGFEMVFLPYLEPYYLMLSMMAGIKIRVGDGNKLLLKLFLTHPVSQSFRNVILHETEQSARLVWGVKPETVLDLTMNLVSSEESLAEARGLLEA
ncbi:lipopolysaccharide heptosyltransferase family protein, partial [bacterium]|nr:lipopolysaccharide heptosyltransferase family protein [bacterium]